MLDALAQVLLVLVTLGGVVGIALHSYTALMATCVAMAVVGWLCWRAVIWIGERLQ